MDVLIIGGGGREHAIALAVKKNIAVEKIYIAPGNGGTSSVGVNVDIEEDNIESLLKFALDSNIDLKITISIYSDPQNRPLKSNQVNHFLKT